ncbi:MAG: RNA polymerase sigma factor [Actinomycetota bacterium]
MRPLQSLDDASLVQAVGRASEPALRELIARHGVRVRAAARAITFDPSTIEEVSQDVFVDLWKRPDRFDPTRGSLSSYLSRIARNKAIDHLRSAAVRQRTQESLAELARQAIDSARSQDEVDLRDWLKRSIEQLDSSQREAVVLAYLGDRTYRQAAIDLGVPEGTLKSRVRQALMNLRREPTEVA